MNTNIFKFTGEKVQELNSTSNLYPVIRARDIEQIKQIILLNPRENYEWYSNLNDNFIMFIFDNEKITFNGITKEELIKIYSECGKECGINLFDKISNENYFQDKELFYK